MNKIIIRLLPSLFLCQATLAVADQPMFNVEAIGASLDISTVANHEYKSAGIKINSSNYELADVGTECTMASNGYCIFSVSDTENKILNLTGETGDLDITLCLDGNNAASCQNFNDLPIKVGKYLYVVDSNYDNSKAEPRGAVFVCNLDSDGNIIGDCNDAGGGVLKDNFYLQGIVLNDDSTMAYLTSSNAIPYVFQCAIYPEDGTFYPCEAVEIYTDNHNAYGTYYGMLALNSDSSMLYLPDYNGANSLTGRLLGCSVDEGLIDGTSCINTGATNLIADGYIVDVKLNAANTLSYISNYNWNPDEYSWLSMCDLNDFSAKPCSEKFGGYLDTEFFNFVGLAGIALYEPESIIYVVEAHNIYACDTSSTNPDLTYFNNCALALEVGEDEYYWGMALNVLNATTAMVYLSDYNTTVQPCAVDLTDMNAAFDCERPSLDSFVETVGLAIGY